MRGSGDHDGDARARFPIFLCSSSSDDVVNELAHNAGGAEDNISCRLCYEEEERDNGDGWSATDEDESISESKRSEDGVMARTTPRAPR